MRTWGPIVASCVLVWVLTPSTFGAAPGAADWEGLSVTLLAPQAMKREAQSGRLDLPLPTGVVTFHLTPNPIAEAALVGKDGVPVGVVRETVTYQGTANGHPARVTTTDAGLFAVVLEDDPLFVQPAWLSDSGAPLDFHHVFRASLVRPSIPDHPAIEAGPDPAPSPPGRAAPPLPTNRVAHFLLEEDALLYQRTSLMGNCEPCWVQIQQAALNTAEAFFAGQLGIRFSITSQWACTTASACPYVGFNSFGWLDAFRNRWETRTDEPPHELGHLLSGQDLSPFDGLAGIAVVNSPFGYALSEFTSVSWLVNVEYWLIAHEIGHNFNGVHEEADVFVNPPILGAVATTIMHPTSDVKFHFSEGTVNPAHNNAARMIAHANERLPP